MLISSTDQLRDRLGIPFSLEQLAAITAPHTMPQAIIAGAGSGKTAVMAARVVWLVGHVGIDPANVLGLTFTRKAAAELASRVRAALAAIGDFSEYGEPTIATYHSFAGQLIAEHGLRLGIEPDARTVADASRFQLIAQVISEFDRPLNYVRTNLSYLINEVADLDNELSEHLVSTADLRKFDEQNIRDAQSVPKQVTLHAEIVETSQARIELSYLVDAFRTKKRELGVIEFSDQMAWGAQVAALPEVSADLRERFEVVLLDEYQDTSIVQRDLLQSLFSGPDSAAGRGHSVTAVGDPAQGIYGWRGAATGNLTGFLSDFPAHDGSLGTSHSLSVSRRCGHDIIGFAGYLARDFYNKPTVARHVAPLQAAPENSVGQVSVALHDTIADEISDLVELVKQRGIERAQSGAEHQWSSIAVLVRLVRENTDLVKAFADEGIPVEIVGLAGLLDLPEVADLLAVLEVLNDMTANHAVVRLLAGPRWRMGDRDLAVLGRRAHQLANPGTSPVETWDVQVELDKATAGVDLTEVVSLAEAAEMPGTAGFSPESLERLADFSSMLTRLRRQLHRPLTELVRLVIDELDLETEVTLAGQSTDNLAVFIDAVHRFAADDPYGSLAGLLAYLRAESEFNKGMEVSAVSEGDSVKLMTVHRAKGLEFDDVFVPFVSGGVFPSSKSRSKWYTSAKTLPVSLRGDAAELPEIAEFTNAAAKGYTAELAAESRLEELRLGYVAMTRARERLHLSGHRWGRTQKKPRDVSEFLDAARMFLDTLGIEPTTWASEPEQGAQNPLLANTRIEWPVEISGVAQRKALAAEVLSRMHDRSSAEAEGRSHLEDEALKPQIAELRADLEVLIEQAQLAEQTDVHVRLPATLSATGTMSLLKDPDRFLQQLARPMPIKPSGAARFGTRFHAWVESRYGQQMLIDPHDLPGQGDDGIEDDADLRELQAKFETGPYAHQTPVDIEAPFSIRLANQQIIGRIDAVFATDGGFEVVDWKTNRQQSADPIQLAIYRLAWAEMHGLALSSVTAAFYYVRSGEVVRHESLADRAELEAQLRLA